ncbi:MAG: hypothetical protein ACRDTF_12925 [Pseudonocardiaceae bacterium]
MAAEAHNKAALILSDCGLADLAQQLCWRQFDIFHAATPLTAETAKFALQPIVNLGRLLIRSGHSDCAYEIFQNAYNVIGAQAATMIDGRHIDFSHLVEEVDGRQGLRRFLWTVLLADGTRALTRAGRWSEALRHIEQHKGIGKRMLDGRQVAILACCAAGECDRALKMLDDSSTPEPWEQAVAACLRTLCLSVSGRPTGSSVTAMVNRYLHVDPTPGQAVFRTRLGLCVLDLAADPGEGGKCEIVAEVVREAVRSGDAYAARDVLSHTLCHAGLSETDMLALAEVIDASGLHRGTMPVNLLEDLMASVEIGEAELVRLLHQEIGIR